MNYKLWDKISPINDISAIDFLSRSPFVDQADELINVGEEDEMLITYEEGISKNYVGDVILICDNNDNVKEIIFKGITANRMNIDSSLEIDDFMLEYYNKL